MNLNQVTVPCTNYDASVAFYKTLGLTQIVDSPPRYARFETEFGTTLSIHDDDRHTSPGVVIYFEVDDVDAKVRQLIDAGLSFDTEPVDQPYRWREAYLSDPAGNRICIFNAGENRRNPPWRIQS